MTHKTFNEFLIFHGENPMVYKPGVDDLNSRLTALEERLKVKVSKPERDAPRGRENQK